MDDHWRDRIDSEVSSLSSRMAGVETSMEGLIHGFDRLSKKIEEKAASEKTPWAVIIATLSLIIIIIGGFMSGYVRDLDRIEKTVNDIRNNKTSQYDAVQNQAINLLRQSNVDLDTILQREMRLLDDAMKEQIHGLDTRLQKEMQLMAASELIRLNELDRRLSGTEDWENEHDKRVVGLNAAQWERIRAVERQVFGIPGNVMFGKPGGS